MADVRRSAMWSPVLGPGVLVWEEPGAWMRFDGADGRVTRFQWSSLAVGTPAHTLAWRKKGRGYAAPAGEAARWITVGTRTGETLAFRDGPPDAQMRAAAQGELFPRGTDAP